MRITPVSRHCGVSRRTYQRAAVRAGLESFYRHRTSTSPTGRAAVPDALRPARVYEHPALRARYVRHAGELAEASLILEGIVCAACAWLNERHLAALPGVVEVGVNYATHRAQVRWNPARTDLGTIIGAIERIGYRAHPFDPDRRQQLLERERRGYLRRLGVSALFGMQVMVFAIALYGGDAYGMDAQFRTLFGWLSLLMASPVVVYGGRGFFQGAWRDLRRGAVGMDVPVALAIGIAFSGSVAALVRGEGDLYFDSVVMFVFLLLGARYLEFNARRRSALGIDALASATPDAATRLLEDDSHEIVPSVELQVGDRVLVRAGEVVPADGEIIAGRSSVDEAVLTGESSPRLRQVGDGLIGGSVNVDSPLTVRVRQAGPDSFVSGLARLAERAQSERPRVAELADRIAAGFIAGVLVVAAATGFWWWQSGSPAWLPITVAVLVVSCPCALSLATPSAFTAAISTLARRGVLVARGRAFEILARVTHVVLDKTGTLTTGHLQLVDTRICGAEQAARCIALGAALGAHSSHPVAQALCAAAGERPPASEVINAPGMGLRGRVDGAELFLGNPEWVAAQAGCSGVVAADLGRALGAVR